ncbi:MULTISPECIES: pro-sigmaK processing inhibitor BofA family protein [Bacillaceae]|uniref:pro-sigmaK processing inhibitor BofA family protein n=1 Tax=Bacillaceae TaxID=186817 RepID=UPI001BDEE2CA|nr:MULTISPECIES: pro-sigmaK processing inhibitor BofA family protein [Bacillaceae]MDX8363392.1 pro-sigmaK processing inhibitor BofA family protein [Cytobacillus sp. IB215316]
MEPILVISIFIFIIVLLLLVGAPIKPLRMIGQGFIKLLIGALFLFFLNAFGASLGLHIPINFITSAISGFLGIPGLTALIIIQLFVLPSV